MHKKGRRRYRSIQSTVFCYFLALFVICVSAAGILYYLFSSDMIDRYLSESHVQNVELRISALDERLDRISGFMDYQFTSSDIKELFRNDLTPFGRLKIEEQIDESIRASIWSFDINVLREFKVLSLEGEELYYFTDFDLKNVLDNHSIEVLAAYARAIEGRRTEFCFVPDSSGSYDILAFRLLLDNAYSHPLGIMAALIETDNLFQNILSDSEGLFTEDGVCVTGNPSISGDEHRYRLENIDAYLVSVPEGMYESEDYRFLLIIMAVALGSGLVSSTVIWRLLKTNMISYINSVSHGLKDIQAKEIVPIERIPGQYSEISDLVTNYNSMVSQLSDLIRANVNEAIARKEAEYQALMMQINPHFIYNALNTVRWMAMIHGADNIREFSENLANLLRHIAKSSGKDDYTLRDEIAIIREYIFMQQLAHNFRFDADISIEDDRILDVRCLNFFLQPIVENAILHGIESRMSGGFLSVSVTHGKINSRGAAVISVFDNGVGFSGGMESGKRKMTGIGLDNIRRRLEAYYGANASISIRSEINEFTEVIITIAEEVQSG